MDIEKPFTFFVESRGSHQEIIVPGRPSNQSWTVRWDKSMEFKRRMISKEEGAAFVADYQKRGFLTGYDGKTIKNMKDRGRGWTVTYPWNTNGDNKMYWRIYSMDAYWALADRLWRPMFFKLTENMDRYSYTEYRIPVMPRIVTMDFVDKWYQVNQSEAQFFNKIYQKAEKTRIIPQKIGEHIVLKIDNHPFVHQPIQRVLIYPTFPKTFPVILDAEKQEQLRQKLLRRDAYRLTGLSDSERSRLAHSQSLKTQGIYNLHWVRWLLLNGGMTSDNAILVSLDTEMKYQALVEKPFSVYWEKNWTRWAGTGKQIFVDVPIPMTEYRPVPIKPVRTKHQDRHVLKRQTWQAVADYQRED